MNLKEDILFSLKPRCPVCQRGRLFRPYTVSIVERCEACETLLSDHDIGDGAAVFIMFILCFSIIPVAWIVELLFAPALWVHVVLWGMVGLLMIGVMLPATKAYIILLEYRHRPGDWKK